MSKTGTELFEKNAVGVDCNVRSSIDANTEDSFLSENEFIHSGMSLFTWLSHFIGSRAK